ncbi:hypothetical protein FOL47_007194 [Perkinsus chesapeaki]|uniref:RRM domain-containing protein n=1 Tax=Perkinsus chesapeaki TaxID=330153 RepID=A0A7J6LMW7_PERCH|nr:hypothetical protein FOL47_007194 [Perkinsus chesapeaki]
MNGTSAPGGSNSASGGGGRPRDGEGRKLFVGGLPGTCEKQHMESYFGQFGQVDDACVMFDRNTGRSRGFGFVVYNQLTDMETCLASGPHVILDKSVDVKRASIDPPPGSGGKGGKGFSGKGKGDRRDDYGMDGGRGSREGDNPCKVFVGGLPNSCDQARLSEHFSRYGAIDEAIVMYEKDTGRHRGFGYVIFSSPADADKAIASRDSNKIDDRWVEVKHARREAPRGKGKGRPMGYGSGGPSSGGGYAQRPPPPSYQSGGGYNRQQQQYGQPPMYSGPPSGGGYHHQQPMMQQQPAPPPGQYGGYGTSPYGARQGGGGGGYGGPPQPAPYGGGYGQAPPPRQAYGQQPGPGYRASPY